jgi:hypothetical protein
MKREPLSHSNDVTSVITAHSSGIVNTTPAQPYYPLFFHIILLRARENIFIFFLPPFWFKVTHEATSPQPVIFKARFLNDFFHVRLLLYNLLLAKGG